MIKSLVSPREVVFRFPFQLEVDWAFQRRSAVKSGLYVRGLKTRRPLPKLAAATSQVVKCNSYVKRPLGVVYRSLFLIFISTRRLTRTHSSSPADGDNSALPRQFHAIIWTHILRGFTETSSVLPQSPLVIFRVKIIITLPERGEIVCRTALKDLFKSSQLLGDINVFSVYKNAVRLRFWE